MGVTKKSCIISWLVGLGLLAVAVLSIVIEVIFSAIVFTVFALFAFWIAISQTKTLFAQLKEQLRREKEHGLHQTRNKVIVASFLSVLALAFLVVCAGAVVLSSRCAYVNDQIMELLIEPVDEDTAEKILRVEKMISEKSPLEQKFVHSKKALEELKLESEQFQLQKQIEMDKQAEEEAARISKGIDELKVYSAIESEKQYIEIRNSISDLKLGDNEFDSLVKGKVDNYSKLLAYEKAFEQLVDTYKDYCGNCGGSGRVRCEYCGGSGKRLVKWYSEGDWGEVSYTNYECKYCSSGRMDCRSCDGGYNFNFG